MPDTRTAAAKIRLCRRYRRKAINTPLSATWDKFDRDSYLFYLNQVEARLKATVTK